MIGGGDGAAGEDDQSDGATINVYYYDTIIYTLMILIIATINSY